MKTALDIAHEAYAARKQAERQAHMLQLRQEMMASLSRQGGSGRGQNAHKKAAASMQHSHTD
ncbi:hypothetical protein [Hymenobacter sp. B1770]|uniref:hypothetical protein n=1 Tax=Hymenobacter sp. B1770 TaxID=1718788 RepID=UPI003CF65B41